MKKSPRVAVLIDRLVLGGVEKTAIEEVRWLRELGIDCRLLVLKRDPTVPDAFRSRLEAIPYEYLDDRIAPRLRTSLRLPGFYFFSLFHLLYAVLLPYHVKRKEWDVILSHNSYTTLSAWTLNRFRGIPYCMFIWDPIASVVVRAYTHGPIKFLRAVLLPIAKLVDRVLARGAQHTFLSSHSYEQYAGGLTVGKPRPVIVPPGCYPADAPRERTGDYVLAATSWKEGKQIEVLLRAAVEARGARLLIAGRWLHPEYRRRIDSMIDELGLSGRVQFEGEYDEAGMSRLARGALTMVTMNAELGFGMPSLEAAAQACTFVCPTVSGIAAYFKDGVEAFYYPEGDAHALAQALGPLLADPQRALAAGTAAWQRARSSLTWRHHADTIAETMGLAVAAQVTS